MEDPSFGEGAPERAVQFAAEIEASVAFAEVLPSQEVECPGHRGFLSAVPSGRERDTE